MLLLLLACVDEEAIALEMERGLAASNEAIISALVGAEWFRWAQEPLIPTLRHGEGCGCPCVDTVTGASPDAFVMTLDYADLGCFPDSDLLPYPVQGHVVLTVEGEEASATLQEVLVDGRIAVTGSPVAKLVEGGVRSEARLTTGPMTATQDLTVQFTDDAVVLDGTVSTASGKVHLGQLEVALVDVFGRCPVPRTGTLTVDADDGDIQVDLHGDGIVSASYAERTSDRVALCAYTPEWW